MEFHISHLFVFLAGITVTHFLLRFFIAPKQKQAWNNIQTLVSYLSFPNSKTRYLQSIEVELLDRYQVEARYDQSTWQRQGYEAFVGQLVDKTRTFPCIYGTKGYKANQLDFLFLDSEELGSAEVAPIIAKGLLKYHRMVEERGRNASLVLMAPPPTFERSVEQYHKVFWSLLHRLRRLDPKPWPADIPVDTQAERWCFNFDNTQAFIAVQTPAHSKRLSRHAPNFALIYQPRYIFDRLFTTEKNRNSATATVRGLVNKYDAIPVSPDVSDYARPGTTESRQYFLLDENVTAQCPYDSLDAEILV